MQKLFRSERLNQRTELGVREFMTRCTWKQKQAVAQTKFLVILRKAHYIRRLEKYENFMAY